MRTLPGGGVPPRHPRRLTAARPRKTAAAVACAALAGVLWAAPAAADPGHPGHHDGEHHDGGCDEPGGPSSCCVSVPLPAPGPHPWQMPQALYDEVAAREHTGPASPGDTVTYCGAAGGPALLALVSAAIVESEWAEAEALAAAAAAPEPGPPPCDPRSRFWVWNNHGFDFGQIRRSADAPAGAWWERLRPRLNLLGLAGPDEDCRDRLWGWTGEEHDESALILHDLRLSPSKPQGRPDWDPEVGERHGDHWLELVPGPEADGDYRFSEDP